MFGQKLLHFEALYFCQHVIIKISYIALANNNLSYRTGWQINYLDDDLMLRELETLTHHSSLYTSYQKDATDFSIM